MSFQVNSSRLANNTFTARAFNTAATVGNAQNFNADASFTPSVNANTFERMSERSAGSMMFAAAAPAPPTWPGPSIFDVSAAKKWFKDLSWSDLGHAALDVAGLVPGIGEAADVANAAWFASEGKFLDAGLSLISMIPGVGDVVGKGTRVALKAADRLSAGQASKILKSLEDLDLNSFLDKLGSYDKLKPHMSKIKDALEDQMTKLEALAGRKGGVESTMRRNAGGRLLNDVSERRAKHILDGDGTGGGHRYGTRTAAERAEYRRTHPNKTMPNEFPQDWSDEAILHAISDIAENGKLAPGGMNGKFKMTGRVNGINMEVIITDLNSRNIVTGYPLQHYGK